MIVTLVNLMVLGAKNISVKGLTVVSGNVGLDKTYKNALKILALAYLIDKSIFKTEQIPLKIDLDVSRGQTVIDEKGVLINVIRNVEKDAFFEIVYDCISNLKTGT